MLGKRLINSNDAAAGGACTTNTNDYPTTNLAYYKMSSAADEKDTYNGTATDVNFNVQGKFGNAGEFNGSSSYVELPTGVRQDNNFTVSFWFNVNSISDGQKPLAFRNGKKLEISLMADGSILTQAGGNTSIYTATSVYTTNTWYNFTLVQSSVTGVTVYLDNTIVASNSGATGDLVTVTGKDLIGAKYSTSLVGQFNGSIDQVRIFNSALDSTQVESLYNEVYCVPTIVPSENFNTVLYTGNDGTQAITGVGFQPDFTWIKQRSGGASHSLQDSVRGAGQSKNLYSDNTAAEGTYGQFGYLSAFGIDGFTVVKGSGSHTNAGSSTYASWNWKAGGDDLPNNDGAITTQVSANVDAGFSIVSYTGSSTLGDTIGHGLNAAPELIICKKTTGATNWAVWSSTFSAASETLFLDLRNRSNQYINRFGTVNSTTFQAGSNGGSEVNPSGGGMIAYCFHSVDGYSKMGSYKGTGATGNTIVTGFRPAFVMIKRTNDTSDWNMWDNRRGNQSILWANGSNQEATNSAYEIIFNSNAFTVNATANFANGSGDSYIFMAFAEEGLPYVTRNATNPFGDSSELALYKFEDDATDAEGNYDGVFTSPAYASGYIDKAAVFNGTSSRIVTGVTPATGSGQFSVSGWVNVDSLSAIRGVFSTITTAVTDRLGFSVHVLTNGKVRALVYDSAGVGIIESTDLITPGTWHHIAFTYSNGLSKIYVDGDVQSSTVNQLITGYYDSINIGRYYASSASLTMLGKIDQVRIFNRALDSGEVTALYNE